MKLRILMRQHEEYAGWGYLMSTIPGFDLEPYQVYAMKCSHIEDTSYLLEVFVGEKLLPILISRVYFKHIKVFPDRRHAIRQWRKDLLMSISIIDNNIKELEENKKKLQQLYDEEE